MNVEDRVKLALSDSALRLQVAAVLRDMGEAGFLVSITKDGTVKISDPVKFYKKPKAVKGAGTGIVVTAEEILEHTEAIDIEMVDYHTTAHNAELDYPSTDGDLLILTKWVSDPDPNDYASQIYGPIFKARGEAFFRRKLNLGINVNDCLHLNDLQSTHPGRVALVRGVEYNPDAPLDFYVMRQKAPSVIPEEIAKIAIFGIYSTLLRDETREPLEQFYQRWFGTLDLLRGDVEMREI